MKCASAGRIILQVPYKAASKGGVWGRRYRWLR